MSACVKLSMYDVQILLYKKKILCYSLWVYKTCIEICCLITAIFSEGEAGNGHFALVNVNPVLQSWSMEFWQRKTFLCQNLHHAMNFHCQNLLHKNYISTICYVKIMSEWCWKELLLLESSAESNGPISESQGWPPPGFTLTGALKRYL